MARADVLVDLALQGGGAHGAFTWGVLDRLLQEPWLHIDGISGTSAGAMNAAVLIHGFEQGGRPQLFVREPHVHPVGRRGSARHEEHAVQAHHVVDAQHAGVPDVMAHDRAPVRVAVGAQRAGPERREAPVLPLGEERIRVDGLQLTQCAAGEDVLRLAGPRLGGQREHLAAHPGLLDRGHEVVRLGEAGHEGLVEVEVFARAGAAQGDRAAALRRGADRHHVHAFQSGSPHIDRHLAFRDYMRAHPALAEQYVALKQRMAEAHPHDMNAYNEGKDSFIKEMEKRALAWAAANRS